ncbi:MAG TPA: PASTA domain-containing protein [Gemmatimonadaceae bacterium]|nr:PASTA domain-containing protein [Gemmatimonadaceae bacterium]
MSWRGRLRRLLPYVIALVGGFFLAYLIVAFFVFPAGVIPQDVRVPNVIGLTVTDAETQLKAKGFTAERGETRFHNAAPKGTVLDQQPAPGSRENPNTRVTLVVSGGQRYATVPGVIGMSRELALNALEQAGFDAGEVTERPSNEPLGAVIDSRPRPGTQAPVPGAVSLVLSSGPTTVIVPDMVGRSLADARLMLRQVGLTVGDIQWGLGAVADASAAVVSQSPPAGAQAAAGSRVNLSVATRTP